MRPTSTGRFGAADVHYLPDGSARAALVVCEDPAMAQVVEEHVVLVPEVAPYVPGELFRRELPCLAQVLACTAPLDLLVVDGYATLDPTGRPGLGARAAQELDVDVIGVAKTRFRSASHAAEVLRGSATAPLFVTTAGAVTVADAARLVARMAGPYRLPDALTRVDRLARGGITAAAPPRGAPGRTRAQAHLVSDPSPQQRRPREPARDDEEPMSLVLTHLDGEATEGTPADLGDLLDELAEADGEHTDVSLGNADGHSLSVLSSWRLVAEDVEEGTFGPLWRQAADRDEALAVMLAFARAELDLTDGAWQPGYGPADG